MNDNRTSHTTDRVGPPDGRPEIRCPLRVLRMFLELGVLAPLCIFGFILGCSTNRVTESLQFDTPATRVELRPETSEPARPELAQHVERVRLDAADAAPADSASMIGRSEITFGTEMTVGSAEASDEQVEAIGSDPALVSTCPHGLSAEEIEEGAPVGRVVVPDVEVTGVQNVAKTLPAAQDGRSGVAPAATAHPAARKIIAPALLPERSIVMIGSRLPSLFRGVPRSQEAKRADAASDVTIRLVQGESGLADATPSQSDAIRDEPDVTRDEPDVIRDEPNAIGNGYVKPIGSHLTFAEGGAQELVEPDEDPAELEEDSAEMDILAEEQPPAEPNSGLGRDHYSIDYVTTNIAVKGREGGLPEEADEARREHGRQTLEEDVLDYSFSGRAWMGHLYQWQASSLCHRPLYFEEINVERYGYSRFPVLQPVVSGANFFATVPILPYKMMAEPSRRPVYSLGHYRPGSCVPNRYNWLPLRPKAGLMEAGVITGLIFAIP